ncbi:uncharacterized protein LOC120320443 isoform X4 [Drosophila yakuba]|uniref:uncharacterized protein LOC120320443 isoform X4 n=1 Tax=Drosophila yakuba TaxID=7245 RepID=UPI0019308158|nr:uncharacterized protein LOC120320443 isoform X4 [Drosophila yakuba]
MEMEAKTTRVFKITSIRRQTANRTRGPDARTCREVGLRNTCVWTQTQSQSQEIAISQ